ncbi:unnamed protein product [Paramecium pentaurelia]|uniref:Uncharacterized protein n=1 Tax=Paramecium pentaurelia TaxID=43138 RepID=A0A8S1YI56_9CILI|nr:unnamed protein product [Paramecium pentaurelia]
MLGCSLHHQIKMMDKFQLEMCLFQFSNVTHLINNAQDQNLINVQILIIDYLQKIFVHPAQLIMKNTMDAEIFVIQTPLYTNGFCQLYLNSFFANAIVQYQQPQWFIKMTWNLQTNLQQKQLLIVTGFLSLILVYIDFDQLSTYSYSIYSFEFQIIMQTFNIIPLNFGVQFLIMEVFEQNIELFRNQQGNLFYQSIQELYNSTYFAQIFRNESGIRTPNNKISSLNYTSNIQYSFITYVDLSKYPFLFSAIGNYSQILTYQFVKTKQQQKILKWIGEIFEGNNF